MALWLLPGLPESHPAPPGDPILLLPPPTCGTTDRPRVDPPGDYPTSHQVLYQVRSSCSLIIPLDS